MKRRKQNHRKGSTCRTIGLWLVLSATMCVYAENASNTKQMLTKAALSSDMLATQPLCKIDSLIKDSAPIRSREPLYIVNGQEVSSDIFAALNPEYIHQLEVLKDASATAVYGTRGAYGVIIASLKTTAQLKEEKSTKQIDALLKTKGVDKRNVRYYVDGKEVSAQIACQTAIAQMEIKTGVDGKTEVYIQPIVFIKGEYE